MSEVTEDHPLRATAERADTAHEWLTIAFGGPPSSGWLRCSDVDAAVIADWEGQAEAGHLSRFGRTHPMTSTGYVLGWYADIAPSVGAMCFLLDRRVPRLDRPALAFRRADEGYPDAVAVLDPRFWCLPQDPAAGHPDATVVTDEQALGAILRVEVRRHADDFLATYQPAARLPRRNLLGAFFDGLDCGFWLSEHGPASREGVVTTARLVLPGSTMEFPDPSRYYVAVDQARREHLTRRRVSCCHYYKVGTDGACTSCPRTTDAERLRRLADGT
jgi:hypothetical protein